MSKKVIGVVLVVLAVGAAGTVYFRARATAQAAQPGEDPHANLPPGLRNLQNMQTHHVRAPLAANSTDQAAMDARESALLEVAHKSLDAKQPEDAIAALNSWRMEIRHSQHAEEADELRVRALYAGGHLEDAQEHVRQFEIKHPNSAMVPVLKKLVTP
jgi:hypothetical protein